MQNWSKTQSTERRVTQKACDSPRHYVEAAASQLWQSPTCLMKTNFNVSNSIVWGYAIVILCCSILATSHGTRTKNYVLWSKMTQVPTHAHAASHLCLRLHLKLQRGARNEEGELVSLLLEAHISSTWSCGMCNKHAINYKPASFFELRIEQPTSTLVVSILTSPSPS